MTTLLVLALLGQLTPDGDGYLVRAGEGCQGIARAQVGPGQAGLEELHRLNPQLGPVPHALVAGQRLTIRAGPDAHISFLKPEVVRRPARAEGFSPAALNEALYRDDQVETLARAGAELAFRDGSLLRLRSDASVVVLGDAPTTRSTATRPEVRFEKGELSLLLQTLRARPLKVGSEAGQVETAQGEALLSVDEVKRYRVSMHQGRAQVSGRGRGVEVPEGHGTRVAVGQEPEPARPLPASPAWQGPQERAVFSRGASTPLSFAVAPVPGAALYRLEVARLKSFAVLEVFARAETSELSVQLPEGELWTRAAAVDADGLVGRSGPAQRVWVLTPALPATGQVPFVVPTQLPEGVTLHDGAAPLPVDQPLWRPGRHLLSAWVGGKETDRFELTLSAPSASLLRTPEGALEVTLGQPLDAQAPLTLRDASGAKLLLTPRDATHWQSPVLRGARRLYSVALGGVELASGVF